MAGHAGCYAGRSLLSVRLSVGAAALRFATVHLESPVPGAPASAPRREQLAEVSATLSAHAQCCCSLDMHLRFLKECPQLFREGNM